MSFRLVPKSLTLNLNDLERRNGLILRFFAELDSFQGPLNYVKVLRYTDIFSERNVAQRI